jgi:hypothetical protein
VNIVEKSRERLMALYQESHFLRVGDASGQTRGAQHLQQCVGWLIAVQNLVHQLVLNPFNPYRARIDLLVGVDRGYLTNEAVGQAAEVLLNLARDLDAGLVNGIVAAAQAEIFDDFLDHADYYLSGKRKEQAGVIAGVVFEDSIRRLSRKQGAPEAGQKLDALISSLATAGSLSQIQAKRARAAASLRTSATHAQWEEFDPSDVRATIDFTRELIRTKLDGVG